MEKQKILPLDERDIERINANRNWVRDHYEVESRGNYETLSGKLHLIDTILRNGWVKPDETAKAQSLGIAFGDALTDELPLRWVTVVDELGRDPALQLEGTSVLFYPLTVISKRLERGEAFDVVELFQTIVGELEQVTPASSV